MSHLECYTCGRRVGKVFMFCASCGVPVCIHCGLGNTLNYKLATIEKNIIGPPKPTWIFLDFPLCYDCNESFFLRKKEGVFYDKSLLRWCWDHRIYTGCPVCGEYAEVDYLNTIKYPTRRVSTGTDLDVPIKGLKKKTLTDEYHLFPNFLICSRCGYEGSFTFGFGLRKFVDKWDNEPLKGTYWYDFSDRVYDFKTPRSTETFDEILKRKPKMVWGGVTGQKIDDKLHMITADLLQPLIPQPINRWKMYPPSQYTTPYVQTRSEERYVSEKWEGQQNYIPPRPITRTDRYSRSVPSTKEIKKRSIPTQNTSEELIYTLPPKTRECPKCSGDIKIPHSNKSKVILKCPFCGAKGRIDNPNYRHREEEITDWD